MIRKKEEYSKYLLKVADNLDISNTARTKAVESYSAVGEWLSEGIDSRVKIKPQGSFNLGTIIKPISDKDEYDIDLICLMEDLKNESNYYIKHIVGNRLKENTKYKQMINHEGKRCWTLNYSEFHMDILPCIPNSNSYVEPNATEIHLTHKHSDGPNGYITKFSNPYQYHLWFKEQMKERFIELQKEIAFKRNIDIAEVPTYDVKTPLQRAIQLLKRHRDIMYKDKSEITRKNAPISIIITTLAAHAYNNEPGLYEALFRILNKMTNYINIENSNYYINNPVMPQENFADKWNLDQGKSKEFYSWLEQAKNDILKDPLNVSGIHNVSEILKKSFGENITKKSIVDLGEDTRHKRENNSLYVSGLAGGLTTKPSNSLINSKQVKNHTFYGN